MRGYSKPPGYLYPLNQVTASPPCPFGITPSVFFDADSAYPILRQSIDRELDAMSEADLQLLLQLIRRIRH